MYAINVLGIFFFFLFFWIILLRLGFLQFGYNPVCHYQCRRGRNSCDAGVDQLCENNPNALNVACSFLFILVQKDT